VIPATPTWGENLSKNRGYAACRPLDSPHKYFVITNIQPAMENAPTQYEAISPELAVSGVELKLFSEDETEETA
jgi:hypothetical protein